MAKALQPMSMLMVHAMETTMGLVHELQLPVDCAAPPKAHTSFT
jgi:hypothetical protein